MHMQIIILGTLLLWCGKLTTTVAIVVHVVVAHGIINNLSLKLFQCYFNSKYYKKSNIKSKKKKIYIY